MTLKMLTPNKHLLSNQRPLYAVLLLSLLLLSLLLLLLLLSLFLY